MKDSMCRVLSLKNIYFICDIRKKKSTKTHPWHVPSLKKCSFNRPHKFHRLVLLNKYISSALCLSTSAKSMLFSLSKISVRSLLHISAHEHVVHVIYLVCVNVFHMPLAHFMKEFPLSILFVSISYCSEYSDSLSCYLPLRILNINVFHS